jgi:hypothetical protein
VVEGEVVVTLREILTETLLLLLVEEVEEVAVAALGVPL